MLVAGVSLVPASASQSESRALVAAVPRSAGGAATIHSLSTDVLWPNPRDRSGPRTVTVRFTIDKPGNYTIWAFGGRFIQSELELGDVEASSDVRTWTWNGRDEYGDVVERGSYRIAIVQNRPNGSYVTVARSNPVDVHNGTQTLVVRDRRRESGTGVADMSWFTLANGHDRVQVVWDFRRRIKPRFTDATALLDVDKSRKGYYVFVTKKRGRLKALISLAVLGTDEGRATRVPCRAARTKLQAKRLTVTIPRSCLKRGGAKMRANYGASTKRGRAFDHGPDNGSYWTSWTTYERPR